MIVKCNHKTYKIKVQIYGYHKNEHCLKKREFVSTKTEVSEGGQKKQVGDAGGVLSKYRLQ